MPRYGDKTFHGKKGRSGRKIFPVEQAKISAIKKAWNIVDGNLDDINSINTALPIALKDMTDKKSVSGDININFDGAFNSPRQPEKNSSTPGQI